MTGALWWKLEVEVGTFEGLESRTATDAITKYVNFVEERLITGSNYSVP